MFVKAKIYSRREQCLAYFEHVTLQIKNMTPDRQYHPTYYLINTFSTLPSERRTILIPFCGVVEANPDML